MVLTRTCKGCRLSDTQPLLSITLKLTTYSPGSSKLWVTLPLLSKVSIVPSSKFQIQFSRLKPGSATEPASPKVMGSLRQTPMDKESGFGSGGSTIELADVGVAQGVVQLMLASHPGAASLAGPLSWKTNVKHPVGLFTVAVTGKP